MSRFWLKARKFLAHKVLHTDDTPHAIALGTAIAMVVAFLPLVGLQTVIAIAIAALFRANKAVCVPIVWITNPFTMGPIYYGCFVLGRLVTPSSTSGNGANILATLGDHRAGAAIVGLQFWKDMFHLLVGLGEELWIGCAIVAMVLGVVSYFLARSAVSSYRERRRRRILQRHLFRSKLQRDKIARQSKPV